MLLKVADYEKERNVRISTEECNGKWEVVN